MQQGDAYAATQELVPVPSAAEDPDGWRGAWRAAGWGLLVAWVLTAVAVVAVGDRPVDPVGPLRLSGVDTGGHHLVTVTMLGREAGDGLALAIGALCLVTLGLLVLGPQPRRATRWAWFWLVWLVPPVGMLAFLVLAGPTGLARPPADPERRQSGLIGLGLLVLVGNAVLVAIALVTLAL